MVKEMKNRRQILIHNIRPRGLKILCNLRSIWASSRFGVSLDMAESLDCCK